MDEFDSLDLLVAVRELEAAVIAWGAAVAALLAVDVRPIRRHLPMSRRSLRGVRPRRRSSVPLRRV
jgi:hypothetical protein